MSASPTPFWDLSVSDLLQALGTTPEGLTTTEARTRLEQHGANVLRPRMRTDSLMLLLGQFKSPIILILVFAALVSFFLHDPTDALIILAIILVSGGLGYWQERGAADAVEKLLAIVRATATVLRDQRATDIPVEEVVSGDIVTLSAGASIPGDCRILESRDLFVDEAALTGETYPVEKVPGRLGPDTPLSQRTNSLFLGTHVISGTATALVVLTGRTTEFGAVSDRLKLRPPETEFEHGIKRFGYFLMEVTMILVIAIFAVNVYLDRPVLESFLFSLALAVGLTPQLLPAIISINLAHGAQRMAREKVIVRRLSSIENFGSMNVLCSDKTGTLTEGVVRLHATLDVAGTDSDKVFRFAYLNAFFETGFLNPIDAAIRSARQLDVSAHEKLDEVPYDFVRKRLSILVAREGRALMITKGALANVLSVCAHFEEPDGSTAALDNARGRIDAQFAALSAQGLRALGVAYRELGSTHVITKDHERDMTFLGLVVVADPPKADALATINQLRQLGVTLKIITGDHHLVAASVGRQVGLTALEVLTGPALRQMSDEALCQRVSAVDLFAEIEPNQKERVILALKEAGHVVGYMGDGINDASALHAADVGISVDSAVDVAKEAADIVLLEKDLGVLVRGVRDGRRTFANTLKYVFMATSANFGNMFSMAGVSLFLPFLPLLPKQILLTNLLTDFPEMTIAGDAVDPELIAQPRRWNIAFIRKFMLTFGLLSTVFDYCTFAALLLFLGATEAQFRTGWFVESVVSASLVVLVIRSRRPFFKSVPGPWLLVATLLVAVVTAALPFTPLAAVFEFVALPPSFLIAVGAIVSLYVVAAEWLKHAFYARTGDKLR